MYICVCVFINSSLVGYITQWDFQNKKYVHNELIVQNTAIEKNLLLFRVRDVGFQVSSRVPFVL